MEKETKERVQEIMQNKELFSVVFAENEEDRTEENAQKIAAETEYAEGIACFADSDGNKYWGVLLRAKEENE